MRILVAEDDRRLADLLEQALREDGWEVEVVHDGRSAYVRALPDGIPHDVLLLDWTLPELDGLTVCQRLRAIGVTTPVLMLTARGDVRDRIDGLQAGADDYLPKPFDLGELLARLHALRRRSSYVEAGLYQVDDLLVDPAARRVSRAGSEIELSAREFDILHLLVSRAGQVVSRFTILDEVWDGETDLRSNVIDVHLAAIRAKIDRPFGTHTITTLRGAGYRVDPAGQSQ
ncbi:MAG: response regulator transcription factor [Nocardioides sp.]|uniref:response regulator transcription factor n=1 Tax=Nocardioides sp. TaxID=35761 RepID=UPI003264A6B5